jgi:hypothetical protein
MQIDQENVTSRLIRRHFLYCFLGGSRRMTNAWAGAKVASRSGTRLRISQGSAAALSVPSLTGENAGEMGWIRTSGEVPDRSLDMAAALLCRSFYFDRPPTRAVDSSYRSAATGTLHA